MHRIVVLAVAGILCGCATQLPVLRWSKPDATYDQFLKDRYSCIRDAKGEAASGYVNQYGGRMNAGTVFDGNMFKSCMNAQGWRLDPNGFAPPADAVVPMH